MAEVVYVDGETGTWWASFAQPADELPGWVAVAHFARPVEQVECTELTYSYVEATNLSELEDWLMERQSSCPPPADVPPGGISARMIRMLKVGEMQSEARRRMAKRTDVGFLLPEAWSDSAKRPGPQPRRNRYYAELAARFCDLLAAGSSDPAAALAAEDNFTVSAMRNRLLYARKKGYLTSPGRGRVGGELTPLGRRTLDTKED